MKTLCCVKTLRWREQDFNGWRHHTCLGSLLVCCQCGQWWLQVSAKIGGEEINPARPEVLREVEVQLTRQLAEALLRPCSRCQAPLALASAEEG